MLFGGLENGQLIMWQIIIGIKQVKHSKVSKLCFSLNLLKKVLSFTDSISCITINPIFDRITVASENTGILSIREMLTLNEVNNINLDYDYFNFNKSRQIEECSESKDCLNIIYLEYSILNIMYVVATNKCSIQIQNQDKKVETMLYGYTINGALINKSKFEEINSFEVSISGNILVGIKNKIEIYDPITFQKCCVYKDEKDMNIINFCLSVDQSVLIYAFYESKNKTDKIVFAKEPIKTSHKKHFLNS